jgi:hypothetical protein
VSESPSDNCEFYQTFADNSKECVSCVSGSSLDVTTKTCKVDDQCFAVLKNPLYNFTLTPNDKGLYYTYSEHALFSRTKSICWTKDEAKPIFENCHTFAHGELGKLACIKCQSGFLPVYSVSTSSGSSEANYVKTDSSGNFLSKVSTRQEILKCVATASVQEVSNCEKYYTLSDNTIGCWSCAFGYAGKVNLGENKISSCEDISSDQCDVSVRHEGLDWTSSFPRTLKFSLGKFLIK